MCAAGFQMPPHLCLGKIVSRVYAVPGYTASAAPSAVALKVVSLSAIFDEDLHTHTRVQSMPWKSLAKNPKGTHDFISPDRSTDLGS